MQPDSRPSLPKWEPASIPEAVPSLIEQGLAPRMARLLARRGVTTATAAKEFLEPSPANFHDPSLMPGLMAGVERLLGARRRNEKVAIVGDYDVDGVSATALLVAVLQAIDLAAEPILPERLKEGYGFQPLHVDIARQKGCSLVVTADCGSTALEAVESARQAGLDVIVTDHHLGTEVGLPDWVIEINPHRADSDYPFPSLSGAGVAYKLSVALLDAVERSVDGDALLRIACLGTICDLVPLLGENRIIAARGLASLTETRSIGLRSLMQKASVKPPVTAVDVGYRIGPRINAAGRLGSPRPALDLLLTRDGGEATRLANDLETWNRQRQQTERQVVEEAEQRFVDLRPLPPILVGWSDGWHPGVLGIAAGRIARIFYRPTVLFSVEGDLAKGSGRSVSGVHLFDFLSKWRDDYARFGGHSQAIGMSVVAARLEELRESWHREAAESWEPAVLTRRYEYELSMAAAEIDESVIQELAVLEPFGIANRQPILRVDALRLDGPPRRFGRGHLSAKATGVDGGRIDLLGWNWQDRENDLEGAFDVLGNLERDRYRGGPVLRLLDARPADAAPAHD